MEKVKKMRTYLLLPILLFATTGLAKSKVAWVFADADLCKTKMCLHGGYKKGTEVVLLSKKDEKTCTAKVGESFKVKYQPGDFEASELTGLKKCKLEPKQVFLAIFDRPNLKYKIFQNQEMKGQELEKIDQKLKKDIFFSRSWKKDIFHPQGNKDRVSYTVADYRRMESEGFEFKIKKEALQILRQKFIDGSNSGLMFSFFQGNWSLVSSTFTIGRPFVFMIDKRILVVSQVTCQLACGYLDNEVYEFNGRRFKLIYNNADLST